jgi:hypothetical protein
MDRFVGLSFIHNMKFRTPENIVSLFITHDVVITIT